jgi:hypothetical protein
MGCGKVRGEWGASEGEEQQPSGIAPVHTTLDGYIVQKHCCIVNCVVILNLFPWAWHRPSYSR